MLGREGVFQTGLLGDKRLVLLAVISADMAGYGFLGLGLVGLLLCSLHHLIILLSYVSEWILISVLILSTCLSAV